MRKIIDRVVAVIFILVVGSVAWVMIPKFYYASSIRSKSAAIFEVKLIREAELRVKPKYGRYLSLEELIEENNIAPDINNHNDYKFKIDISDEKFLIHAVPLSDKSGEDFSMDEKGDMQ